MSKKVTLTFSDESYETIARAAGGKPLGRFLRETVERDSVDGEGDARVGRVVDAKLEAAVARLLKDQTYVELETAERVAERALKWAKIAGVILAIPAAIFVALFSFLGVKTYFDLRDVGTKIADAENTIVLAKEISRQSQATSKDLIDRAAALKSGLTKAEATVTRLLQLEQQIPQLLERQRDLEEDVNVFKFTALTAAIDNIKKKEVVYNLIRNPIFTSDPSTKEIIDAQAITATADVPALTAEENIRTFSLEDAKTFLKLLVLNIDRTAATLNVLQSAFRPFITKESFSKDSNTIRLGNFIYPGGDRTLDPIADNLKKLRAWMARSDVGLSIVPIATLLYGGQLGLLRARAVKEIPVP